jgi:hypothetical protein
MSRPVRRQYRGLQSLERKRILNLWLRDIKLAGTAMRATAPAAMAFAARPQAKESDE